MAQYVTTPTKSFIANAAMGAHLRVKLSSGEIVLAGSTDVELGTTENVVVAADDPIAVRLRTAQGTCKMVASEAITAGDPVYAAASGKVASTGTVFVGNALEAAAANNDVIEVLRGPNTDVTATIASTNAAAFEVDADASTPKIALSGQSGGTGDYTTTLKPETTLSGDNSIIVPEANGDTLVAVALAQTLTSKTLTSPVLNALPKFQNTVTPVAAAGTTVADAAALASTMINHITSDGATKGVKFPTATQNMLMIVINNSSTAAELYAASGGTVNGLSADASVVIPASKGVLAFATGADTWIVFDMPAKATAS
jgi:hypothetical protein